MIQTEKISKLLKIAATFPEGFTVYTTNLEPVKSGWAVALKETQNGFGNAGMLNALRVAEEKTGVIGGWKDGNKFYWDAVAIFEDEETATRAGIENGQIAIYSIDQNRPKLL